VLDCQVWLYVNNKVYIDTVDAIKQVKSHKARRTVVFGVHAFSLLFLVYM
jgi:hypothetical protein